MRGSTACTVAASPGPGGHCPDPLGIRPLPLAGTLHTLIRIKKQMALQGKGCALVCKKNQGRVTRPGQVVEPKHSLGEDGPVGSSPLNMGLWGEEWVTVGGLGALS